MVPIYTCRYLRAVPFDLGATYGHSGPATPIFFLLSPEVDPVGAVQALGKARGVTEEGGAFCSVSLGQGQEAVAEKALEQMHTSGGWVMLQVSPSPTLLPPPPILPPSPHPL